MKCRDCNAYEADNLRELMKHKTTDCPAQKTTSDVVDEISGRHDTIAGTPPAAEPLGTVIPLLIPLDKCPEEVRYLGPGNYIGLKILGRIVDGGVLVDDIKYI